MPNKIGITGGIGSGKSTVCKIFEVLGIPVYYADDRAKSLMVQDKALVEAIKKLLGEAAYQADGQLDRGYVANIIFRDKDKLAALNALVHPAVAKDGESWHFSQKNVPYTLKEAALLFEAGSYKHLDKLICVVAPKAMRLKRVMERDQVEESAVLARMDKQWPQSKKAVLSDFIIYNDGSIPLIPQVLRIHKKLVAHSLTN
ncbi:MAG: dephospho-CoA kinase [Saprospiraceae bacterium]